MSIDSKLRARVDSFVGDLSELIRQSALESVREAFGSDAAPARRGPGRPRKSAGRKKSTARKATARKATRPAAKKAGKRGRRSADVERFSQSGHPWRHFVRTAACRPDA